MAEISDIVRVSARIGSSGVDRAEFGRTFFLYPEIDITTALASITKAILDARKPLVESVPVFSNQTGVAAAFDSAEVPYKTGNVYFQQQPFPRNLLVGSWYAAGAAAYIYGGPIGTTTGLSTPLVTFAENNLTLVDFSSDDSAAIAVKLQIAIRALAGFGASGVEVSVLTVGSVSRFVVKVPISDVAAFTSGFAGVSADELGLDVDSALVYAGVSAEDIETSLDRLAGLNDEWYWLTLAPEIEDSQANTLAVASWIASRIKQLVYSSREAATLDTDETGSTIAVLRALNYPRVAAIWSARADYQSCLPGRLYVHCRF